MASEDKLFVVTYSGGLYIRSSGEKTNNNLGEDFDLDEGDVIHAVSVAVSGGITFHKFDRIYRDGIPYDLPFKGFPMNQVSPSGEYWAAEKSGTAVFMKETEKTDLPAEVPGTDNKIINDPQTPSADRYVGWRVLHKEEGGYQDTPPNMPEVLPPENPDGLYMTENIQRMSFALMKHFNNDINEKIWTAVHNGERAFTNYQGFGPGKKSGAPRKNFISGADLGDNIELPKYDKMGRVCGGMFIRGMEQSGYLVCKPGIHGIDARKPLPDIDTIVEKNWYFFALAWYPGKNNKPGYVAHLPSGPEGKIAIPFIFDREVKFPIKYFEKWDSNELPDPLKYHRPPK